MVHAYLIPIFIIVHVSHGADGVLRLPRINYRELYRELVSSSLLTKSIFFSPTPCSTESVPLINTKQKI